jgi:tetratricopeptide (TPR) repeat protein
MLLLGGLLIGMIACASPGRVTRYDLGVEAQDRGEIAPALEYYKEMLMEHPEHLRARFNLAVLYHDQKRYPEAKYHYQALLDRYPMHARSMVNLADIAMAEGRPTQAHDIHEAFVTLAQSLICFNILKNGLC